AESLLGMSATLRQRPGECCEPGAHEKGTPPTKDPTALRVAAHVLFLEAFSRRSRLEGKKLAGLASSFQAISPRLPLVPVLAAAVGAPLERNVRFLVPWSRVEDCRVAAAAHRFAKSDPLRRQWGSRKNDDDGRPRARRRDGRKADLVPDRGPGSSPGREPRI